MKLPEDIVQYLYQTWIDCRSAILWQFAYCMTLQSFRDGDVAEVQAMRRWTKQWNDNCHDVRERNILELMEIAHVAPPRINEFLYTHQSDFPWICTHTRRMRVDFRLFELHTPILSVTELVLFDLGGSTVMRAPTHVWPNVTTLTSPATGLTKRLECTPNVTELVIGHGREREVVYIPDNLFPRLRILKFDAMVNINVPRDVVALSLETIAVFGDWWETALNAELLEWLFRHSPHLHTVQFDRPFAIQMPISTTVRRLKVSIGGLRYIGSFPNVEVLEVLGYECYYPRAKTDMLPPPPATLHTVIIKATHYFEYFEEYRRLCS